MRSFSFCAALVLALTSLPAQAVPMAFTHQGRLHDAAGLPLDTTEDVTFAIYDAPAAGIEVWSETQSIDFDRGYFSVELGAGLDSTVFDGSTRYLEITVGAGAPLPARIAIVSVPYAIKAGDVDAVTCTGCISDSALDTTVSDAFVSTSGDTITGTLSADSFVGDGSGLTGIALPSGDCPTGEVLYGIEADGTLKCQGVFAGLPDTDGDGEVDLIDTDDDNDGVPDDLDLFPLDDAIATVDMVIRDGSTAAGTDLWLQYSPIGTGAGELKANWDAVPTVSGYEVSVGTSPGAANIAAVTEIGASATDHTFTGLDVVGAWVDGAPTYYVTVTPLFSGNDLTGSFTSNGVMIAEAALFDGTDYSVVRGQDATDGATLDGALAKGGGGWKEDFPTGAGWQTIYGNHYFETVDIAAGVTVWVSPFGWADSVPESVSASDSAVTSAKDGWVGLYANAITVDGSIDARGRGYGGGAGGNHASTLSGDAHGGANGLSGSGGGQGPGIGSGGGGGGSHRNTNTGGAGDGGPRGGGGGGYSNPSKDGGDADAVTGAGGQGGHACGGDAGGADYTGGGGAKGTIAYCGGGGGGGYGGGGGGGGWDGHGGGGGGTGGARVPQGQRPGGAGAGPAAGPGGGNGTGGAPGGYDTAGGNTDSSTDATLWLGSGGGGGGGGDGGNAEGGGAGGAGGGAIRLYASGDVSISGAVLAGGGSGGGGGWGGGGNDTGSGGAGGGGGGIALHADTLELVSGAAVRTLGGEAGEDRQAARAGDGADGDVATANGGTVKIFADTVDGDVSATVSAGRVYEE